MNRSDAPSRILMRWVPALAVMAVIFLLSSQSGLRVSDDAEVDRPIRGLAHLLAYAVLGGLLIYGLVGPDRRPILRDVLVAFAVAVLYGITDEIHQAFIPDRAGRIDDVVVDAIGAAIGVTVAVVLSAWRGRAGAGSSGRARS